MRHPMGKQTMERVEKDMREYARDKNKKVSQHFIKGLGPDFLEGDSRLPKDEPAIVKALEHMTNLREALKKMQSADSEYIDLTIKFLTRTANSTENPVSG